MPKGSSSENVHFDFRGRTYDTSTSTSTINSVGSVRSNQTRTSEYIGSAKKGPYNNDREYSNVQIQIDSRKKLVLSEFFNTSRADNSPAYENLCSGCGYGVFEARGELCNFCQYVLNGSVGDNANIYENICDKCSQLFSGDECMVCLENNKHNSEYDNNSSNTSPKKKLKKRLIHSLLGSLKRVKSFNASSSASASHTHAAANLKSPNRKLQIVHNVDGFENVFCTNETFDLNRICELKQQQQQQQQKQKLKASTSDHHIYGKLRRSEDEHLHEASFECIKQKSQSDDYLISGTGAAAADSCCDPLFCSTSINNQDSFDNKNFSSSSSYLHIQTNSVSEWMTSLRFETHDYYSFGAPDNVLINPKSIPGNFIELCASSFVFYPRHVVYTAYDQMQASQSQSQAQASTVSSSFSDTVTVSQVEFTQQMVNEFKRNLMDKPGSHSIPHKQHLNTKRHGIHLNLDDSENRQRAENNYHQVDVVVGRNDLVSMPMVGDHQQRNDSNCSLKSYAQAQTIALAAGLNGGRRESEHQLNKRCAIYEKDSDFVSDILQVFDSILLRESHTSLSSLSSSSSSTSSLSASSSLSLSPSSLSSSPLLLSFESEKVELRNIKNRQVVNEVFLDFIPHSRSDSNIGVVLFPHKINLEQIVYDLAISKSLNKVVINYEFPLKLFLSGVDKSAHISHLTYPILKKIFRYFQVFLCKQKLKVQTRLSIVTSDCCSESRSLETSRQIPAIIRRRVHHPLAEIDSFNNIEMTVPKGTSNTKAEEDEKEESIYQPIWKFKTVGEVQESDITDEYYDDHVPSRCDSSNSLAGVTEIEDLDEWMPDNDFIFTTKLDVVRASANKEADTISVNTIQSCSGSTITGYASSVSTMNLSSTTSSLCGAESNRHHPFRNICILYSPKNPNTRAILYEYDRDRCSSYFAHQHQMPRMLAAISSSPSSSSSSKSTSPSFVKKTGCGGSNGCMPTTSADYYNTLRSPAHENNFIEKSSESGSRLLADSVQAWKYLLLDVDYLEDEEDMIVPESQILKAQKVKEMHTTVSTLKKFKSYSIDNLAGPTEETKESIGEKMKNKILRGYNKLNLRSPKESKKKRKAVGNGTASLYIDGDISKYPIFKAPLDSLELNDTSYPNVPRFVVDCVEKIEQKDCIHMDGLYRASGNKVDIDKLKEKLTKSYVYDPVLLDTDDIHTLTSLLKMFFRELGSPLIPHNTYKSITSTNCMDPSAIEQIKMAFQTMPNPNRETLKFFIKHLTTVAHYSNENRMPASNLAIVLGPCIFANQLDLDIGRMNTLARVLIENYDQIFGDNERLVS